MVICFICFAAVFFLLRVQVISSNGLSFHCLVVGKCFVCRGGCNAFVRMGGRRDSPII